MSGNSKKPPRQQQVYTLLVEIGRKAGDGLPDKATGAALMIYASGVDEAEAVRETVAILKQADTAMYQAKTEGRARLRRYQPWMRDDVNKRVAEQASTPPIDR